MLDFNIKENADVSLHDCRSNHIEFDKNHITFRFPDGFYVRNHSEWSKTLSGKMTCHIALDDTDGFSAYIFRKNIFGKTLREDRSKSIIRDINGGKYEFEFVTVYRSYQFVLFKGYLWSDKKPYNTEYEIEIHTDEIIYSREE